MTAATTALEALRGDYASLAEVVAAGFTTQHQGDETLERVVEQFLRLPVTEVKSDWSAARKLQAATLPMPGSSDAYLAYWLEGYNEASERYCLWTDHGVCVEATHQQVLVASLAKQLRWSLRNFIAAETANTGSLDVERSIRLEEQSRLLGLVEPAWSRPLGRLSITEPAPFDDIDSIESLRLAHQAMVDRCTEALDGMLPADAVAKSLEPKWTTSPDDFSFNGGTKGFLVGPFLPNSWEFAYEWRERAGTFGQPATAEQLLWTTAQSLTKVCIEHSVDPNIALIAAEPTWRTDYKPTKMRDRSLPVF